MTREERAKECLMKLDTTPLAWKLSFVSDALYFHAHEQKIRLFEIMMREMKKDKYRLKNGGLSVKFIDDIRRKYIDTEKYIEAEDIQARQDVR